VFFERLEAINKHDLRNVYRIVYESGDDHNIFYGFKIFMYSEETIF